MDKRVTTVSLTTDAIAAPFCANAGIKIVFKEKFKSAQVIVHLSSFFSSPIVSST